MGHNTIIFVVLAITYSFLTGFIIFVVIKNKKNIAKKLFLDKEKIHQLSKFKGTNLFYKEREYQAKYQKATRNTPASFSLSIKINTYGIFRITLETSFDKFAKRINIAREIQTGDYNFDERFYIDSPTPDFTKVFLSNAKIRDKITQLFNFGFTEISLKNNFLILSTNLKQRTVKIDEDLIKKALDCLFVINDHLLNVTNYQKNDVSIITKLKTIFYLATILIGIIGFIMFIAGVINYKPLDAGEMFLNSLLYSGIALILYLYYTLKFLRGYSFSHKYLLSILIISIFSFSIAGYGVMLFLNGYLDKSTTNSHNVAVIKKYYRRGKNGTTYYIKVDSWRNGRTFETIKTSNKFYKNLIINSYVTINTQKGKFAYEWLKNYTQYK